MWRVKDGDKLATKSSCHGEHCKWGYTTVWATETQMHESDMTKMKRIRTPGMWQLVSYCIVRPLVPLCHLQSAVVGDILYSRGLQVVSYEELVPYGSVGNGSAMTLRLKGRTVPTMRATIL